MHQFELNGREAGGGQCLLSRYQYIGGQIDAVRGGGDVGGAA